jgi:hypothetical protein
LPFHAHQGLFYIFVPFDFQNENFVCISTSPIPATRGYRLYTFPFLTPVLGEENSLQVLKRLIKDGLRKITKISSQIQSYNNGGLHIKISRN